MKCIKRESGPTMPTEKYQKPTRGAWALSGWERLGFISTDRKAFSVIHSQKKKHLPLFENPRIRYHSYIFFIICGRLGKNLEKFIPTIKSSPLRARLKFWECFLAWVLSQSNGYKRFKININSFQFHSLWSYTR